MGLELGGLAPTQQQLAALRAAFGLGNVDNTADSDKPVSGPVAAALETKPDATATANALAGKQPMLPGGGNSSNWLRGDLTWGVPAGSLAGSPLTVSVKAYLAAQGVSFTPTDLTSQSNTYGTDITAQLQAIFDLGAGGAPLCVINDVRGLVSGQGVAIHGNTELLQMPGCGLMGKDGFTLRNANPVVTTGTPIDKYIRIRGGILHGNNRASSGTRATSTVVSGVNIWGRTIGMFGVEHVVVEDIDMRDPWGYHMLISGQGRVDVERIHLTRGRTEWVSGDGVHIVGAKRFNVCDITGASVDDMVSICGEDGNAVGATGGAAGVYGPYVTSGVVFGRVSNIVGTAGMGVRMLPVGQAFHVHVDGVHGTFEDTPFIVDDDPEDGIPGTRSRNVVITIENVTCTAGLAHNYVLVGASIKPLFTGLFRIRGTGRRLVVRNVSFARADALFLAWVANCDWDEMIFQNVGVADGQNTPSPALVFHPGCNIRRLVLDGVVMDRGDAASVVNAPLAYLGHGAGAAGPATVSAGTIGSIVVRGGRTVGSTTALQWGSGTIGRLSIDGTLEMSNYGSSTGAIETGGQTLPELVLSASVSLPAVLSTGSTATVKRGSYYGGSTPTTTPTAGAASASVASSALQLAMSSASGGTTPYSYTWYRSATKGAAGSAISAALSSAPYSDTSQPDAGTYWYSCRVTDATTGNATSNQVAGAKVPASAILAAFFNASSSTPLASYTSDFGPALGTIGATVTVLGGSLLPVIGSSENSAGAEVNLGATDIALNVTVSTGVGGAAQIIFRKTDANNFMFFNLNPFASGGGGVTYYFGSVVAGTATVLATGTVPGLAANHTTPVTIKAFGTGNNSGANSAGVYLNGSGTALAKVDIPAGLASGTKADLLLIGGGVDATYASGTVAFRGLTVGPATSA